MSEHDSRISARIAALSWPSPENIHQMAVDPQAAGGLLPQWLMETICLFGMEYGRILLAHDLSRFEFQGYCATRETVLPVCSRIGWVEQQVIMQKTPLFITVADPITFFPADCGVPPLAQVLAVPIRRRQALLGVLSLGGASPVAVQPEDVEALVALYHRVAANLPCRVPALLPLCQYQAMRELLAEMPWPMLLLDGNEQLLSINPAAETLLGYASADLREKPFAEILQPVDQPAPRSDGEAAYVLRQDATRVLVEMKRSALLPAGDLSLTLVVLHDLSHEQLLFEERLKTAELAGTFRTIATVNHEINNPLFGLLATLQLLRDELADAAPSVQRKLERMGECGERIKKITDNLSRVIRPARRTYAAEEGMLDLAHATGDPLEGDPRSETPPSD
ncbi:MAG: histidine kinase dimerization/phospho-acceptor domain-containing protein [Armatimonadota bacterium]